MFRNIGNYKEMVLLFSDFSVYLEMLFPDFPMFRNI